MSFPRYQKYKDSGVEWLGEVPEHWSIGKNAGRISSLIGPSRVRAIGERRFVPSR